MPRTDETGARDRRAVGRWLRRGIVGLAVAVVTLVVLLAAVSQTAAFRSWLRDRVVLAANTSIDGVLTIGAVEGNLVGGLILRDVRLEHEDQRVVAIERVAVAYDLAALWRPRQLRITSLVVEHADVALVEDARGWNVTRVVPPSEEEPPAQASAGLPLVVDAFRLDGVRLEVTRAESRHRIRGLAASGSLVLAGDGAVAVDALRVATPDSELRGHVRLGAEGATDVALTLDRLAAVDVAALAGRPVLDQDLSGSVRCQGPRAALEIAAAVESGDGEVRLAGVVDLVADPPRIDGRIEVARLDAAALLAAEAPVTDLSGHATLAGTLAVGPALGLEVALVLAPGRVGAVALEEARADATVDGGTLVIDTLRVETDAARLTASGRLALEGAVAAGAATAAGRPEGDATPRGSLTFALAAEDLAPLGALVGAPSLGGAASVAGTLAGSLEDLDVDARGTGRALAFEDVRVDALQIELHARDVGARGGAAELSGRLEGIRVGTQRFAELTLAGEATRTEAATDVVATATAVDPAAARFDLALRGRLGADESRVTITRLRLPLGETLWTVRDEPTVVWRDGRLSTDGLTLASPRGRLRVEGAGGTRGPLAVRVALADADLALVDPRLEGRGDARVDLGGTAAAPALDAVVDLGSPTIASVPYEEVTATVTIADGQAAARLDVDQAGSRALSARAALPLALSLAPWSLTPGDTLTGQVRARAVDLAFLTASLPAGSALGGQLDGDLSLAGPPTDPVVTGTVTVQGGRVRVPSLGLAWDPIELEASVEPGRARLTRLEVTSDGGTLAADGSIALPPAAGDAAIALRATLETFPLVRNDLVEAVASGSVALSGTMAAPVVEGTLTSDALVLKIPEELPAPPPPPDPTITVLGGTPAGGTVAVATEADAQAGPPPPDLYERAAIRVRVDVPRNAWVRRSDANIELRGAITADKEPHGELRLVGEIGAVRGFYSFRGKKFRVVRGEVEFAGVGTDLDPRLDVVAMHRTAEYDVFARVGGTISSPSLVLESEPPLPQADVLSVLLLGKTTRDLRGREAMALRDQAVAVSGSYAADTLARSVADRLGLDSIDVASDPSSPRDTQVTMGKYVNEDIFVSLSHHFGTEAVESVTIEYALTPQWSIETSSDTLGRSAIDLFWKRQY